MIMPLSTYSGVFNDKQFNQPYIDIDEWRDDPVRYHYIHGGFTGTNARFSFFYPEASQYQGRFFHFMAPVQGSENAAVGRPGVENKIAFAVSHGAYFVETNMGVDQPFVPISDSTLIPRASAAAAEYSREIAQQIYGPHRPFGYLYGGSGGGYKTMILFENSAVWDGAVPYVIGTPMSIPYQFTVRAHARRILRHKMHLIADAVEAGGKGDIYAGLNQEEQDALREITRMGFPLRNWFMHRDLDDGSLPVLTPAVDLMDPGYYQDFWTVPGYLGADPDGSAVRDRIYYETTVAGVIMPGTSTEPVDTDTMSGVDEAWQRVRGDSVLAGKTWLRLEQMPAEDAYIYGTLLTVLSGEAAGLAVPLESLQAGAVSVGAGFGIANMAEMLQKIRPGDHVRLDNSDYLALQTYHRHQLPAAGYEPWDQYRDAEGNPLYPQRPAIIGTGLAASGCHKLQSGLFEGKMIVVASLQDEAAFPWNADWYRRLVRENKGGHEEDYFRIWYTDHALHGDLEHMPYEHHIVSYLGTLHQALLDVSDWVERGIEPPASTNYIVKDGQVSTPASAADRLGLQPTVQLWVNGGECARVKAGDKLHFTAVAELPAGTGRLVAAAWNFDGKPGFPIKGELASLNGDGCRAELSADYTYAMSGTYFATLRVQASRQGTADDIFTQIYELARVRVVVETA
ncbi:MAG TPA: hypothetical protein DCM45_01670 [Clostridiales bacterium]|nr:hypothetical protein [Clostridiales bacterium]